MSPIFDGYFEMGGTEILNRQRAYQYAATADCPPGWLRFGDCHGLDEALGDTDYASGNMVEAPWYDVEDEATHRFYGAYPLELKGISDSTRTASITEGIADGGVIQGVRRAVKQVRCKAILIGRGQDAVEAGLAWMDAALDLQNCSTHQGTCGEVDACFFVACPPQRDEVTTPVISWLPIVENLFVQPTPHSDDVYESVGMAKTFIVDPPDADFVRGEVNDAGFAFFNLTNAASRIPVIPGEALTFQAGVRLGITAAAAVMRLLWMKADGTFIPSGTQDGIPTMSHDWTRIAVTATPPVGAVWAGVYILLASGSPLGATLDVRNVMAQRGDELSPFFNGDTYGGEDNTEMTRTRWLDVPNDSPSVLEVAEFVQSPDMVLYEEIIDGLRRTMHGVVTISGPIITEVMRRENFWGYIVEFTVAAGTPYVYSLTKEITLDATVASVFADIPYNLIPYPSAALAEVASITVATNYSTNPSVEVNTTTWSALGSASIVAAGTVTGSQSTDIAADGASSYRTQVVTTSSGGPGSLYTRNTVTIPTTTAQSRISVKAWAFSNNTGTAVLGIKTVTAVWRTGSTELRRDLLGTLAAGASGSVGQQSIEPPVGADNVMVETMLSITSWVSGAQLLLYSDTVAVTIP